MKYAKRLQNFTLVEVLSHARPNILNILNWTIIETRFKGTGLTLAVKLLVPIYILGSKLRCKVSPRIYTALSSSRYVCSDNLDNFKETMPFLQLYIGAVRDMATNPNNAILSWLLVSHQPDQGLFLHPEKVRTLFCLPCVVIKICIDSLQ